MKNNHDDADSTAEVCRLPEAGGGASLSAEVIQFLIEETEPLDGGNQILDFRWRLAQRLIEGTASAEQADDCVRKAAVFLKQLHQIADSASAEKLRQEQTHFMRAYLWHNRPGLGPRWAIEAYALCRMSPEEIADALNESETAVALYLNLFFDISAIIDKPALLGLHVLGVAGETYRPEYDRLWKLAALVGGKRLLDVVICGADLSPDSEFAAKAEELIQFSLQLRLVRAALAPEQADKETRNMLNKYQRPSLQPADLDHGAPKTDFKLLLDAGRKYCAITNKEREYKGPYILNPFNGRPYAYDLRGGIPPELMDHAYAKDWIANGARPIGETSAEPLPDQVAPNETRS